MHWVRQGFVLAPLLLNIFLLQITQLLHRELEDISGVIVGFRLDRNLFNTRSLQATSKIKQASSPFGKLSHWVFQNKHLHLHTKVSIYQASPAALQLWSLDLLQPHQLYSSNTEVLERTALTVLWPQHQQCLGMWSGSGWPWIDCPSKTLYGQLHLGLQRSAGGQKCLSFDLLNQLNYFRMPSIDRGCWFQLISFGIIKALS